LIVVNLAPLALEHLPAIHGPHKDLFTAEYLLRLFAASPFTVIDLVVIAPYWLHLLGIVELDPRGSAGAAPAASVEVVA
jgi:hypothetical protein